MLKQSPWSSAIEKGIDSLADWLIPTLGRPVDFTYIYIGLEVDFEGYHNAGVKKKK